MKLKFNETIEREMEVQIPCYRTNGTFIVKVLGEKESLSVHVDGEGFAHREGFFWGCEDYFKKDWKESTQEAFEESCSKFTAMMQEQMTKHFNGETSQAA